MIPLLAALATLPAAQARDTVILDPIVAVARHPDPVARLPLAATVITLDPSRVVVGRSLADLMMAVPGLYTADRGNPAQDDPIGVRGVGARAAFGVRGVRVFLDGVPQTLPDGQTQVTAVDPAALARLEVLRGAVSAWYGNAAGGAILFTSAAPTSRTVALEGRAGAYGTSRLGVAATAGDGGRGVRLAGAREAGDGRRTHSAYETWRGSVSGFAPLLGGRNATHVTVTHQPLLEDPGALTAAEVAADPRSAAPANVAVNARKSVTHVQGGTALSWDGGPVDASTAVWGQVRDLENWLPFAQITLGRTAVGARVSVDVALGPRLTLGGGVEGQAMRDDRVNRTPDGATIERDQVERATEVAPWLQSRWRPSETLTVLATGRVDAVRFSATDRLLSDGDDSGARTLWAPSIALGMAAAVHPAARPWIGLATTFETPTTTELTNRADGGSGFNPDLDPERGVQVEAGLRGGAAGAAWEVVAWRAWVRDGLVPFESPLEPGRIAYRNAGEVTRTGGEVWAHVRPVPLVAVEASLTLSDFRYDRFSTIAGTFDGNRIPGVPTRQAWTRLTVGSAGAWVAADLRARSALLADDANAAAAAPWAVLGFRAGAAGRVGPAGIAGWVAVENVFDRGYVGAVRVNAGGGRYYEPGAGRTVTVAFSVSPLAGAPRSPARQSPR